MSNTTKRPRAGTSDADWRWIRQRFPLHLNALAKRHHAACFWRNVPSAEVLLRMILLWALCGFGLRSVAAWAHRSRWAHLTADSLRYRFRNAETFLREVLTHVLSHWLRVDVSEGMPLRLVDASMLAVAGPSGRCLRVHAVFDPRRGVLTSVELTDDKGAESLSRGPHDVGDLVIADRGYAHARNLVALSARRVWWLVRVHLGTLKLWDESGARIDRRAVTLCDEVDASGEPKAYAVWVRDGESVVAARLVVAALPRDKAEAARKALRQRASKKGKSTDPVSLHLAGYTTLLTTLPTPVASVGAVLQWYRVRWQVELFFKRCKSLLGLRTIVTACDQLQRVRVLASLLVASLIDQMNEPAFAQTNEVPPSLWRWTAVHHLDLLRAVSGDTPMQLRHERVETTAPRLRDRPRRRMERHAAVTIAAMEKSLRSAAPLAS